MKIKSQLNEPKLRFNGFNDKWEHNQFRNFLKVFDGTHKTPEYFEKGIPFYGVEFITSKKFNYVDEKQFIAFKKTYTPETNDVLFTRIGIIGESKIITENDSLNFCIYVSICAIRIIQNMYPLFFHYVIQTPSFKKELRVNSLTKAVPAKINIVNLYKLNISYPCFNEQHKIAHFFSLLDKQIELWETKLQLNELKYFFLKNRYFMKSSIEKLKLSDNFKIVNGFPFKSTSLHNNGKYRIITIKNISSNNDIHNIYDCKYINIIPSTFDKNLLIMPGDLVATLTGESGFKIAISNTNGLLNQRNIKILSLSPGKISVFYLKEFLSTKRITMWINSKSTGNQKNISHKDLLNIEIPIFSDSEWFESLLNKLIFLKSKIIQKIQMLKLIKTFYLSKIFI